MMDYILYLGNFHRISVYEFRVYFCFKNAVVRGTLLGMQHMGKDRGGKGGTIVNISSIVGVCPTDLFPVYCGSKYAVVGLSRSFAVRFILHSN